MESLLQEGARRLLAKAIEAEVAEYVAVTEQEVVAARGTATAFTATSIKKERRFSPS